MTKTLISSLLLTSCWLGWCPLTLASADRELAVLKDAVVKVAAGSKTGSGFILELRDTSAYVLTAFHVLEGDSAPRVTFFRDPHHSASAVVVRNQFELGDRGLAILRVDIDDTHGLLPLSFSQDVELDLGTAADAIGFYGAGRVLWSTTKSTLVGEANGTIVFEGAIEEGNSGGPLIQDGQVIGVVLAKGAAHHEAVPARQAETFVESVVGVLPVECNVPLIPAKKCAGYVRVDRRICDYLRQGNRFYEDGAYDSAIAEYDRAVAYKERDAVLFNNRGVIKLTNRDFSGALQDIEEALRRDPDYLIAEINQLFTKAMVAYFRRLEQLSKGEIPSLEGLRDLLDQGARDESAHAEATATESSSLTDMLLKRLGSGVAWWTDYKTLDAWLKSYHLGNMECYGGDILIGNNEITRRQLKDLTEMLQAFVD